MIPRQVHRQAKAKFIRSNARSFAAWVAVVLEDAPEQLSHTQATKCAAIERALRATNKENLR